MTEESSYLPSEVAQMIVSAFDYLKKGENIGEFMQIVPRDVRAAIPIREATIEEKDSYSPAEIAKVYILYRDFCGAASKTIEEGKVYDGSYESSVPANVQKAIAGLNGIINDSNSGEVNNLDVRAREGRFEKLLRRRKIIR